MCICVVCFPFLKKCIGTTICAGELAAEGKVIHRADIQPTDSSVYMKLKRLVLYGGKGGRRGGVVWGNGQRNDLEEG